MDCCQDTASIRSTNHRQQPYQDLETILTDLPYQNSTLTVKEENMPNMIVSLDLPGDDEYLPTYWPNQNITGEVKIQLRNDLPIQVTHLRIALFGNVQVHGDHPGKSMTNGLFDYQKNEQLINTGLRVVRKSAKQQQAPARASNNIDNRFHTVQSLPDSISHQQQNDDNDGVAIGGQQNERRWKLHCRKDIRNAEVGPLDLQQQQQSSNDGKKKSHKTQKTPEDRHIERLIRRVAALNHTSNVCNGFLYDPNPCSSQHHHKKTEDAFELNADSGTTNTIAFSIRVPASRKLTGSFEHSHCPITYRIVTIMKCKDNDNNDMTCYATVKLRLESIMDMQAPKFTSSFQTTPTRQYVQNNRSILTSMFTYILSSSSVMTYWLQKATQQKKLAPDSSYPSTSLYSSFLQSHLELPKQAFERSQYIPLQLIFENYASSHFKISAIKIYVEFVRRINMTCSMNEEIEGTAIKSATVCFKSSEEEEQGVEQINNTVFFKYAKMFFDLSKLIQVPHDCTCTIFSESIRDIFSLQYDLNVRLNVTGVTRGKDGISTVTTAIGAGESSQSYQYYASDKHLMQQEQQAEEKEPHQYQCKTYTLHLNPINVVIGNSNEQNNL